MILIEEQDDRFYIGKSTVPDAGNGLFAAKALKKGDILEIVGVQVKAGSNADKCTDYAFTYKFAASEKDASRYVVPMGFAGMVNHCRERQNALIRGLKSRPPQNRNSGQMVYQMIRDIEIGEEILGDYGNEWEETFSLLKKGDEDWETFMSYQLYNLGMLYSKGETCHG